MSQSIRPNLLEYFEYAEYLKDFYSWSKEVDQSFSYQKWAKAAGLASKGYLRMVVIGKRKLTDETFNKLLPTINLNTLEEKFFRLLLKLDRAKKLSEKAEYYEELIKVKSSDKIKDVENTYEYLSNEWLPRLHILLDIKNISRTEKALSKCLGIPLQEVMNLCKKLEELGYAEKIEDQWVSKDTITYISNRINNIAVQRFHKNSLETSIEALNLHSSERHFNAAYYTLDKKSYEKVTKKIDNFTKELLLEFSQINTDEERKLYQVNTNLVPMSENLIRREERARELT